MSEWDDSMERIKWVTLNKLLNRCKCYIVIGREENPTNGSVRTMANFEIGKTYYTRSLCDNNMIFKVKVTKRTEKTVTIEGYRNKRCKVHIDKDGDEFIVPESYSMAPTFRASREVA